MKRSLMTALTAAVLSGTVALPTLVQAAPINERQHDQQARIRQGARTGSLTERESESLEAREARIRTQEAYDRRSGGKFTPAERARIQHELNGESRSIYDQKHDAQTGHSYTGVNGRQSEQEHRIWQGEHSGSLTEREAAELQAREARIRTQEYYDRRSGGRFSPAERAQIQRELNHSSRAIYHQKHDDQHRY